MNLCPVALRYVCLSVALGFAQILISSHATNLQRGYHCARRNRASRVSTTPVSHAA